MKDLFCGDTLNTVAKTDKEFHQSRYTIGIQTCVHKDASLGHLKTTNLVKAGCMPKVFGAPEFVLWC